MRPAPPRGQDGFTLVELLITMSIFTLVLMGIFQIFEPSNAAYVSSEHRLGVQQNARISMDMVVRQIRMAGYFPENVDTDTTNDIANPVSVQVATDAALAVAGDLDGSGTSSAFLFCRDVSGLRRVKGALGVATSYQCATGDILAESVTRLSFAYYDANNNPVQNPPTAPFQLDGQPVGVAPTFINTTQRSAVRRVVITMTARESVPGQPDQTYTLTSDVRFRNP